jgi:hypothetical protein
MTPPKASRPATAQTASEPRKVVPHLDAIKIEKKAQTRERGTLDGNGVEGRRGGPWTPISPDPAGKRVICICLCGAARQIALEALENGMTLGCGCRATPIRTPASTFASGVAEAELNDAWSRHRGGGR